MAHDYASSVTRQPLTTEEKVARILGGLAVLALLVAAAWWLGGVKAMFLFGAWAVWWLFGVDWARTWQFLAGGAWLPFVLLGVMGALVFSQVFPSDHVLLNRFIMPNFWWQLGALGLWFAAALFFGWLQGVIFWHPVEVELEPASEADHGHGHH